MYSLIFDSEGKLAFKEMIKDRRSLISVFYKTRSHTKCDLKGLGYPNKSA